MLLNNLQPLTKLPFHGVILPSIEIDNKYKVLVGAPENCTNLEFITQLCRKGFRERVIGRVSKEKHQQYADQVKYELNIIDELGFINYILMVWDICRFADESKIPRGPGRGSVGSSLVSYLIGITDLDPVENGLFFTRFLSKARAKSKMVDGVRYIDGSLVPDIDCDFSYYRRDEIVSYLGQRYPNQTSKLLTTTTFSSKILIKDVMKTFGGRNEDEANAVSDLIEREFGIPEDLEFALSDDENKQNIKFKEWAAEEGNKEICEIALKLADLNRSEGQHASAVLISYDRLENSMPLQLASEKEIVSGFDMYSAQEICIKMDVLGLRTLDVIDNACKLLKIDRDKIDVHHESIYRYLQDFQHKYGIFQLETFAQGNAAAKVKPKNFEQLSAVLAIARPGAFAYLEQYIKYLHEGIYNSVHPLVDEILKPTGGVCLYQEQYLAMLVKVGMTTEEAENARRVLGKKKKEEVPAVKAQITEICKRNNHPSEIVDLLVKIAEDSGGYSFNKSHAASYALITAWSLYLKTNHPLEYYYSLLSMAKHESAPQEVIQAIEREMRAQGFKLLPPHFMESDMSFKIIDEKSIRFALGLIHGISEKSMSHLQLFLTESKGKAMDKFALFQSLKNAGLNIGIGAALIQAGCMDGYNSYKDKDGKNITSRSRLVLEICTWNLLTDTEKKLCLNCGEHKDVNWDVISAIKFVSQQTNDKGKPLMKPTRLETLRKKYKPYADIYEMNRRNENLANYFYERKVLGYSYSETLQSIFGKYIENLSNIAKVKSSPVNSKHRMMGFVEEPTKGKTKKGNSEFRFRLIDETGDIRVKTFNDKIELIETENGRLPEEEDLVQLNVKKMEGDTLFLERTTIDSSLLTIQTAKIYMRLSELKDEKARKVKEKEETVIPI